MPAYPVIHLPPGREVFLQNRNLSLFRSTFSGTPNIPDGDIVEVRSSQNAFLCYAQWNSKAFICARVIGWEQRDPLQQLHDAIAKAVRLRALLLDREDTTAVRLINAEGDAVPGIIVDRYGDVLCLQLTTLGMDRLRDWIVNTLKELTGLQSVFEKSGGTGRKKEGLEPKEGWLCGAVPEPVVVTERGARFEIALTGSQKTGLFLDQREMRSLVRTFAKDRTVLDICSYVGGFTVNALLGGAKAADAVDYDGFALERVKRHVHINGLPEDVCETYAEDAFAFLRRSPFPRGYDFIVLDPPAFAKRSDELEQAQKAYTDLNRMAMEKLPAGGLLLTCSCSYQIDPLTFQKIVFDATRQAKRSVRILQRHRQALDHPVNLVHPEGDYLKSLLLLVE